MGISKIKGDKSLKEKRLAKKQVPDVSLDDQMKLARILNDTPTIVALEGTEWAIRPLRAGTQNLIAEKVLEINANTPKEDSDGEKQDAFSGTVNHFAKSVPATIHIFTLALLNDKNKIYEDGDPSKGFSELYEATYDTLMWDCDPKQFGKILIETLSLLDISFFLQSLDMLDVFRQAVTKKKRMRTKTKEQK
jgi:hypothetical protein